MLCERKTKFKKKKKQFAKVKMSKEEQKDGQVTKPKVASNETTLKATVDDELTKIGQGGPWVW